LKPSVQILDELADLEWPLVVSQGNRVHSEPRKLFDERNQGLQVFFDANVEGIAVLEINGDYVY